MTMNCPKPLLLLSETIILVRSDGKIKNSAPVIGNNIQKVYEDGEMKMEIMKRGR